MKAHGRPLPWEPLLEALPEARLVAVREALAAAGTDPLNRDAFLLDGEVGRLLQDLAPPDGPPESLHAWGVLLHALFLEWTSGWPVRSLDGALLETIVRQPRDIKRREERRVCYVQLPERAVWAQPSPQAPHEPLDGMFVFAEPARVRVLAVLDFRPSRGGFTTMEAAVELPAPVPPPRPDGSAPFSSALPGGERAGIHSVVDTHELASLGCLALEV